MQIVRSILNRGFFNIINLILQNIVEDRVEDQAADSLENRVKDVLRGLNKFSPKLPALERLAIREVLVFDGVTLSDSGNFFLGIDCFQKYDSVISKNFRRWYSILKTFRITRLK